MFDSDDALVRIDMSEYMEKVRQVLASTVVPIFSENMLTNILALCTPDSTLSHD